MSRDSDRNLVAAISYIPFFAVIISLVIFLVEKDDKFVRFHALQSLIIAVSYYLALFIFGNVPLLGSFINTAVVVVALVIWIVSMVKAYQGQVFKWPIVGNFVEKKLAR